MKVSIIVLSLLASLSSFAVEKIYIVNGKEMSAAEATLASLKGAESVFKCTPVKAEASKSGSISLKTLK